MPTPSAAPGRTLPAGMRLGRYTLDHLLARGGMAELYLARAQGAEGFEKLIAIKLVLPHLADDPGFLQMFLDEARLASRLDHPNIAQVLDLGHEQGEHFMAMEYVHGRTVRDLLAESEGKLKIGLDSAVTIVLEASRGLHYAHELTDEDGQPLGIVHRDVSPSNLMVRYDGVVKLLDFGIAKAANRNQATRTGVLKGKSGYMSPEQCRGLPVDRRSDVFGLGILLYELTTGQRLFYGDNEFAILNRIVDGEFERPSEVVPGYPAQLENIVLQALDPRVENRFPTASNLQEALEAFIRRAGIESSAKCLISLMRALFGEAPPLTASRPFVATPISGPLTSSIRRRRGRLAALGLGLAGSCIAVVGYLAGTASSSTPPEPPPATPEGPAPAPAAAPAAAPVPAIVPVPLPTPAPAAVDQPEGSERVEPEGKAGPESRSKRRRAKKRPKRRTEAKPKPGQTPDSMMPRE